MHGTLRGKPINNGWAENNPQIMPQMHCANSVSIIPKVSFVYDPKVKKIKSLSFGHFLAFFK